MPLVTGPWGGRRAFLPASTIMLAGPAISGKYAVQRRAEPPRRVFFPLGTRELHIHYPEELHQRGGAECSETV